MFRLLSSTFFAASLGIIQTLSAQHHEVKLLETHFFMVQNGDTIEGMYDPLLLKDGQFAAYIQTTFSGAGKRRLHLKGRHEANLKDPFETQCHLLLSGQLNNGAPAGEWFHHTANFKDYSTCYGGLFWKRFDYSSPDTVVVTFYNGRDYFSPSGQLLGGERWSNSSLVYECGTDSCTVREPEGGHSIQVHLREIEMTIDRISFSGF